VAESIRILLADDHAVLRAGLRALLDALPDMTVVGEASDGLVCIEIARQYQPDIILLDINMPRLNGLEALEQLQQVAPSSRVLVLTMHDDIGYLRQVLAAGGAGYILKRAMSDDLIAALRAVHEGGTYLHPTHTRALLDDMLNQPPAPEAREVERYDRLSKREAQIFKLIALGHRNSEIAAMLHLSVKTVETYKSRLMEKLELRSRAELVRYALELGLLDE
jgi:two-component system, NarL family, response regulator NreC